MSDRNVKKLLRVAGITFITGSAIVLAFFGANYIAEDQSAQLFVEKFGFLGILSLAFIGGLNLIVPVPAASFTPVFLASGFEMTTIILALVIGTTIADLIGYFIGYLGKNTAEHKYPRMHRAILRFRQRHEKLLVPGIFFYSALMPFPNEVMLVPLGLTGLKLRYVLLPVILGTFVSQTVMAYGFNGIFELVFR